MKKLLLAFAFLCCFTSIKAKDWVQYVNPLVGTQSTFELSTGNTYPAIARPWGMNFWTPQTGKMGDGWQYVYTANKIRGFKQTHQPSPWINDYGQFSIMPVTGQPVFDEDKRASWFSHKGEVALPHYYKVYLAAARCTATAASAARLLWKRNRPLIFWPTRTRTSALSSRSATVLIPSHGRKVPMRLDAAICGTL